MSRGLERAYRLCHGLHRMENDQNLAKRTPQRLEPRLYGFTALLDERRLCLGQFGDDEPGTLSLEGTDSDERFVRGDAQRPVEHIPGHGEWNDLYRGDHLAFADGGKGRDSRDGQALMQPV